MQTEGVTLFTAPAVLDFLSKIPELEGADLGVQEVPDGSVTFLINNTVYTIDTSQAEELEVDDQTLETIAEVSDEGHDQLYNDLSENDANSEFDIASEGELVEGGIIKNAIKSLLLGGMIRFANKHLLK